MRALVVDHAAPARVRLAEVPDPVPASHEALVAVRAVSVNPGELAGRIGAAEVHADLSHVDRVHHALDTVGGAHLVAAFRLLRARGTLVSIGRASGEPIVFDPADLVADHGRSGIRLRTYFLVEDLDGYPDDIAWLALRVRDGALATDVGERVPFDSLATRLAEPMRGKLVATLD